MASGGNQGSNEGHGNSDSGGGNPGQGGGNPGQGGGREKFEIQIDRAKYEVTKSVMTGAELRAVPPGGIPADRDLFEVVPGAPDKKIGDTDRVQMRDGLRFFTAPGQINPGGFWK
ncbi:MAG TPA: multiubiquitin domain-containing protein [Pseudolabrys sp.]